MQRTPSGRRAHPALAAALAAVLVVGALPARAADQTGEDLRYRLAGPLVDLVHRPAAAPQGAGAEPTRIDVEIFPLPGHEEAVLAALGPDTGPVVVGEMIGASLTTAEIAALGTDAGVAWVRPAAVPHVEAVTGQEVAFMEADGWQAAGITGGGVKVAVIDPGFGGYTTRQTAGDLPQRLRTKDFCSGSLTSDGNHGTAVAEIVHETAPDALLYLVCVSTLSDLSTATDWAVAEGIDVVVHSVAWFPPGRGDGTGPLQSIMQAARDGGILWVNSAGNYGDTHWMGSFTDVDTDHWNEFATGDETLRFQVAAGSSATVYLRWDDWPASNTDFDLYLYRGAIEVASSTDPQTGTQPPEEEVTYFNGTILPQYIDISISKFSGDPAPILDLFVLGAMDGTLEYPVAAGSINDPAVSPLVLAAGAVWYGDGSIEYYSSQGPTIDGRIKPDLVTPDGVSNATYGNFYGTSAAAPAAGGSAALIRQSEGCPSAASLFTAVLDHTTDTGAAGDDNAYGAGWLKLGTPPSDADPVVRYSGANRYATAAAVSQEDFACGAKTVFVAVGSDFPDALAGTAAAGRTGAPILLVRPDEVPAETDTELTRLAPDTIVILGGTSVVSSAVETALGAHGTVVRLAGTNRYETSVAVSEYAFPDGAKTVVVVPGQSFADALSGGPAAVHLGAPVLLTAGTALPPEVAAEIQRLAPTRIYVIGGPVVVSDAVVDELNDLAPTTRLSGDDRYQTAVAVSQTVFASGSVRVYAAVGTDFPDALAGGAAAGFFDGPVLLVHSNQLAPVVSDEIERLGTLKAVVLGGTGVISAPVEAAIDAIVP